MTDAAPFTLHSGDASGARRGTLELPHGPVETPIFMPVGTQATVKTLSPDELRDAGATIILANAYHLLLRPGPERLQRFGGLHRFMQWDRNVLTDSGGYQVMSLAELVRVDDEGVSFRSHLDGDALRLTPESVLDAQDAYGSDVSMVLDVCPRLPAERRVIEDAVRRTSAWAERSAAWLARRKDAAGYEGRLVFAINQGGADAELRVRSADELVAFDFPGYALGGLFVGEQKDRSHAMIETVCPRLPVDRPRYLMGVGTPVDIIEAVSRGIDMFDCVLPTRNARNGQVFTRDGRRIIKNAMYRDDEAPLDNDCHCYTCRRFSRAYLRHLFTTGELLGLRLLTLHSVAFYLAMMDEIRQSIAARDFAAWKSAFLERYQGGEAARAT